MEKQKEFPRFTYTTKAKGEKEKEKKNQNPFVLQSPLSCPTSPIKVVHFSNVVANDKSYFEGFHINSITAKLENYKLGPEHQSWFLGSVHSSLWSKGKFNIQESRY